MWQGGAERPPQITAPLPSEENVTTEPPNLCLWNLESPGEPWRVLKNKKPVFRVQVLEMNRDEHMNPAICQPQRSTVKMSS